jgi:DUF1680 family protein
MLKDGDIEIVQKTEYPKNGNATFNIKNPQKRAITLKFYIPSFAKTVLLNGVETEVLDNFVFYATDNETDYVSISFDIPLLKVDCKILRGYHKFMHGNVLLGANTDEEVSSLTFEKDFTYKTAEGIVFDRVGNTIFKEEIEYQLKALFKTE